MDVLANCFESELVVLRSPEKEFESFAECFANCCCRYANAKAIQHKIEPAIPAMIAPIKLDCENDSALDDADEVVDARIGVAVGTKGEVRISNFEIDIEFEVALYKSKAWERTARF